MDLKHLEPLFHNVKVAGLSMDQYMALRTVRDPETQTTQTSLAKFMHVSSAAATGTTDRLEALGLVARTFDKEDRRKIVLKLTPQGEKTMQTIEDFEVEEKPASTQTAPPAETTVAAPVKKENNPIGAHPPATSATQAAQQTQQGGPAPAIHKQVNLPPNVEPGADGHP